MDGGFLFICVLYSHFFHERDWQEILVLYARFQSLMPCCVSVNADGLCTRLITPCPRIRPAVHFRELEVNRDAVKFINKLGAGCFGEVWKGMH